ncbi:SIMPL domain-containing protein [Patescibacteria group bacterium]|nr:SIMPL domain-containing protein [Patescibacteria group bacterium]
MEEEKNSCCASSYHQKYIIIALIVLGLVAICIISLLREKIVNPQDYQVSFTAEGRVFAKPDIAQIVVAVKTDRVKEAVQAVQNNTEKMNLVVNKIKEFGIEEKDIKTTSYRLSPVYDYHRETGQQTLAGYDVYQEVTIKIRDLDKVGEVIEATTSVGVNQVGNISFTIDDTDEVKKEAREEAVIKAKAKAKEMADLTGLKLGKLVNVYESEDAYPYYRDYAVNAMAMEGFGGAGAVPSIQTGENEVRLQVTLVYEVK